MSLSPEDYYNRVALEGLIRVLHAVCEEALSELRTLLDVALADCLDAAEQLDDGKIDKMVRRIQKSREHPYVAKQALESYS